MSRTFLIVVSAALASAASAAPLTYTLDGNHSFERFSYNHMGMSTQLSRFDSVARKLLSCPAPVEILPRASSLRLSFGSGATQQLSGVETFVLRHAHLRF